MSDFSPLGRTHHADFADTVGREIVMEEETFLVFTFNGINDLCVLTRTERSDNQRLSLSTSK